MYIDYNNRQESGKLNYLSYLEVIVVYIKEPCKLDKRTNKKT